MPVFINFMTIFVVMPDVIGVLLVVIVRLEFCMGTYFSFRSWLYFVVYVLRFICVSATLILGNVFFLFVMVTIRCVKFTNKYCAKRFESVQILYVKELCPISAMEVRSLKIFINFYVLKSCSCLVAFIQEFINDLVIYVWFSNLPI